MLGLSPNRYAAVAAVFSAFVLSSCSTDPIVSAVRPTKEDIAEQPKPAPAGSMPALLRMGEATRQAGDLANALGYFRRAHQVDIFAPAPLVKIGVTLNDLGRYNEAAEAFKDAIAVDHNNTEALRGLGTALIGLNQPALAVDNLKAALAIEPDYRTYNALGVASDHLRDHGAAQNYYNEGLREFPNNLTLLNNLGLSQILSGNLEEASNTLVTAAQLPGSGPRQRQNLALAYGLAGRDQEAARVLRLDLDNRAIQSNLAYYGILRAADNTALMAAVMGVHVPVKAPAPPPAQSSELPAEDTGTDMLPANGPDAAPDTGAQMVPRERRSSVISLRTHPSGDTHQGNQIKVFPSIAEIEVKELDAGKTAAVIEPAEADAVALAPQPETNPVAETNTAQPAAEMDSLGQEPVPPAVAAAEDSAPQAETADPSQAEADAEVDAGDYVLLNSNEAAETELEAAEPDASEAGPAPDTDPDSQPSEQAVETQPQAAEDDASEAGESTEGTESPAVEDMTAIEPQAGEPAMREAAPALITTGYSDLAPEAPAQETAAAGRSVPAPDPYGAPIWYAEPQAQQGGSGRGENFVKAITDFFSGLAGTKTPEPAAKAVTPAAARNAERDEVAAIQPAAGPPLLGAAAASDSTFESQLDLSKRYLQRLDSVRAADPPPGTGLTPNAAP